MLALEIFVVVALIAFNGVLAMAELAVVSSRRTRLKGMAVEGHRGAAVALDLAANPSRFLSAVQVGITLIGVLSGAVSGATLGERLSMVLADLGVPHAYAPMIGVGTVVVLITYLSVIIGELVPKQLALRNPERIASAIAPAMAIGARLAGPFVAIFDVSGRAVLRLFGAPPTSMTVTDEEVRAFISEATSAGVIEPEERLMISQVMRLGDRPVRAVMTPRPDVDTIDLSADPDEIRQKLRTSIHTRLPVYRGNSQEIVGIIQAKDLLNAYLSGGEVDPRQFVRAPVIVPDTIAAIDVIDKFKQSPVHMALVYDEYGHFQGIVTMADILEAIAGAFRTEEGPPQPKYVQRAEGSWLIDGDLPVDEMADLLGIRLPSSTTYQTTAGFLLAALGRLPRVGEDVVSHGWRFEVVDLDGRRIDKVLVERLPIGRRRAGENR